MVSLITTLTSILTASAALIKCTKVSNLNCRQKHSIKNFGENIKDTKTTISLIANENHKEILTTICDAVNECMNDLYVNKYSASYNERIQMMTTIFRNYGGSSECNLNVILNDCLEAFKHALQHENKRIRLAMMEQTFDTLIQFYISNLKFIETDSDVLMVMLSSVNEALLQFKLPHVSFQCTGDIDMPVAMEICINAAVASETQLEFIYNDAYHCVMPYDKKSIILISDENVCTIMALMIHKRYIPKLIVLTENKVVIGVYVSKHFPVNHLRNEFTIGSKISSCAHVMQDTMLLKGCKKIFGFVQTTTTLGCLYFLH